MQFEIQPIEATDIDDFLDICAELNAFDGSAPFNREAVRAAALPLLENLQLGWAVWLLADGQRAGYLVLCFGWSFEFGGRTAVLEHLYVREPFRRQGIATAAIQWAESFCMAEGVGCIYLGVDGTNAPAQNLYRQCGFEDSGFNFWMKPPGRDGK